MLTRGEYLNPGDAIAFATPAFLPPMTADAPRNRLGFARWMFDEENPLVARVAVNRAWQVFFGDGLVRTPEDFGTQCAPPLQHELLDALAVRFRESGWKTKALHRMIVMSAVYKQSSVASASLLAQDPENHLLARAPRVRLPAMILRDTALAASGLLDTTVAGAPVYPYQPDRVWEPLAITKERDFTYPASHGNDLYRRSLYTFWRRTIAPANMFDASQRQSCRVRLVTTNSPLAALTTLNDPTWVEAARVLAQRVMRETTDASIQVDRAFARVLSREPTAAERALLAELRARQHAHYAHDAAAAAALLAQGESPRDETLDLAHHAALTMACLAIFNLDEALTRE